MVLSFAGYSFCKGHSCSYIQVAQQSCYLRAHYPAEFFAAVLANGGGFYAPFAYVAEARRAGVTMLPPDVNASEFRTTGRDREIRVGFQYVKGLSAGAGERILCARNGVRGGAADRVRCGRDGVGAGAPDRAPSVPAGARTGLPPRAAGSAAPAVVSWTEGPARAQGARAGAAAGGESR